MSKIISLIILAVFFSCNTSQKTKLEYYDAQNESFQYSGRYQNKGEGVALIGSAASAKLRVLGDSCTIYLQSGNENHQYISLEINQRHLGRFRIEGDSISLALPNKEGAAELTIYKDTEASNGSVIFKGISAEGIESVAQTKNWTIEFIGDSITCGMGADTADIDCEEGEWFDQHNAYLAYGSRIAHALGADFQLSCVSGIGMYRNWNDEDQPVMPDVYSNMYLNSDTSSKANFDHRVPDVVSIALGTNDLSGGDGVKERKEFSREKFTKNYIHFIEEIINFYPNTKIALLSSPMLGDAQNEVLLECLEEVKANFKEKEIFIFEFSKMQAGGCTGHPDIEDHERIAEELIPFFEDILN